uniref:Phorbol-ester/DAG-type domain-containing protein n=1 Tax=Fundulus heteroclitus TaxID=8078 RepID=A0A3Q2P0G1_FUNHE
MSQIWPAVPIIQEKKELQRERAKERDREAKERVCRTTSSSNGHRLVPGSFSSSATCSLCSKSLQKKHGLCTRTNAGSPSVHRCYAHTHTHTLSYL